MKMPGRLSAACVLAIGFLAAGSALLLLDRTRVRANTCAVLTHRQAGNAGQAPCLDIRHFVVFMNSVADDRKVTGRQCAWAVRAGLQAGGLDFEKYPYYSKDYAPFLAGLDFSKIPNDSRPQPGDIMVLQPGLNPSGHVQVWDGRRWVSDFMQPPNRGQYQGKGYRDIDAPYALYRYPRPCQ
jgi:hypothetical protein